MLPLKAEKDTAPGVCVHVICHMPLVIIGLFVFLVAHTVQFLKHDSVLVNQQRLVMEVGNLLVDITWHQHVSLYEFVTNFCSLPPVPSISRSDESTSLHRSDLEESVQKELVMFKEMRTSISVNVSHATIKLDLWRDDASPSLEGKTDKISKLIFIVQGGTMVVDREIWKKSKPSLSDSTTNDAPGLQESNYDVVDRGKVLVAHLGVSTSRTETAIRVCDHSSLQEEVHSVHTFPVVQKGTTGSLSENEPIVTATWSSGPQGTTKGAIEVSPLDWFIDSRLIEEVRVLSNLLNWYNYMGAYSGVFLTCSYCGKMIKSVKVSQSLTYFVKVTSSSIYAPTISHLFCCTYTTLSLGRLFSYGTLGPSNCNIL